VSCSGHQVSQARVHGGEQVKGEFNKSCAMKPFGGRGRDRTGDPLLAKPGSRLQLLHPLLLTTNVSNKSGNLLLAQRSPQLFENVGFLHSPRHIDAPAFWDCVSGNPFFGTVDHQEDICSEYVFYSVPPTGSRRTRMRLTSITMMLPNCMGSSRPYGDFRRHRFRQHLGIAR